MKMLMMVETREKKEKMLAGENIYRDKKKEESERQSCIQQIQPERNREREREEDSLTLCSHQSRPTLFFSYLPLRLLLSLLNKILFFG